MGEIKGSSLAEQTHAWALVITADLCRRELRTRARAEAVSSARFQLGVPAWLNRAPLDPRQATSDRSSA